MADEQHHAHQGKDDPPKDSIQQEAEDRRLDFADTFGNDGNFEDGLLKCIDATAKICGIVFGREAANDAFQGMVAKYFGFLTKEMHWRAALDEEMSGLYSELPAGTLFHDLEAYANYGILTRPARDADQRDAVMEEMMGQAADFVEIVPAREWDLGFEHLTKIASKALVRWKLDKGDPIDADELATISERARQTIANNLGRTGKPIVGNARRIEANEARAWLNSLPDYRESIWRHQDDSELLSLIEAPLEGVCFVPVASDGSVFSEGSRRGGVFTIGREGNEEYVSDFTEALQKLQVMPTPIWRRPTETGVWTRVRGVEWRRVELREVEA